MGRNNLSLYYAGGGVMLAWMAAVTAFAWQRIPEGTRLAVHFNAAGQADRYGSKAEALLVLPGILAVMYPLLGLLPRLDPRARHMQESGRAYASICLSLFAGLGVLHTGLVLHHLGLLPRQVSLLSLLAVPLGMMFVVIGNYMGKVRSNFFCGLRTPWTLSSEESWVKSNRLAGILFVLSGLVMILAGLASSPLGMQASIALLLGGSLFSVAYSWFVWKNDPHREGAGQ